MDAEERESFKNYVDIMKLTMDTSYDPCENFMAYAFGNAHRSRDNEVLKAFHRTAHNLDPFEIVLKDEEITSPSLEKARNFQRSMADSAKSILQNSGLHQFCDGWPAFNEHWNQDNFDLTRTLGWLTAMGINVILSANPSYREDARFTELYINIPNYPQISDNENYKVIREELNGIGVTEQKVEEVVNDFNAVTEILHDFTLEGSDDYRVEQVTFEEISNEQEFNYFNYFEAAIGAVEKSDFFHIRTHCKTKLAEFFSILSEVEKRILANYIMMIAIFRYEGDVRITEKYFKPAVLAAGFSKYFIADHERKFLERVQNFLESLKTVPDQIKPDEIEEAEQYLAARKVGRDFIDQFLSLEKIDKEYDSLVITSDNFQQNILNLQRFQAPEAITKLFTFPRGEELLTHYLYYSIHMYKKPMLHYILEMDHHSWYNALKKENLYSMEDKSELSKLDKIERELRSLRHNPGYSEDEQDPNYSPNYAWHKIKVMRFMFNNYKDWLKRNERIASEQDEILSEIGLNNHQAFFVAYALTREMMDLEYSERNLIQNIYFFGMDEFMDVFKCKSNKFGNCSA